jgi:hypothetical protein
MKANLTNAGKKEQRQINQVINKAVKQGRGVEANEIEARTVRKQHSLKHRKTK